MTDTFTAILPNGQEIPGVPVGTDTAIIQDIAIKNGMATIEDFKITTPPPVPVPDVDSPWYEDVGNFVKENMDIPLGMSTAIAGAKVGAEMKSPLAAFVLGTAGGAVGTFGGSLISDELTEEELDFNTAVEESLIGMGIDITTFGFGKPIKAAWLAGRKALGFGPAEIAEELVTSSTKVAEAGTPESLRQTQKLLEAKGATLTRYQTGNASALEVFGEKIGEAGIVSGKEHSENMAKVNAAAQSTIDDIFGTLDIRTGASPSELGEGLSSVISAGKQAMGQVYKEGLDKIGADISNKVVNTSGISKKLKGFLDKYTEETFGIVKGKPVTKGVTVLDDAAKDFVNGQLKGAFELGNMSAQSLLKVDKLITQQIGKFGDKAGGVYNTVAEGQLREMQDVLKTAMIDTLKQADPKAAEAYRLLKQAYKEGSANLLPSINKNTILSADAGNYDALGNLLTTQTNVSKISVMMRSIDEAYSQLGKVKGLPSDIPYATAKEAKMAIKQSFLKNLMPLAGGANFDIKAYAELATRFSTPAGNKRLSVILGEDYASVKQLFNLFEEASKKPEGNLGTLFLRSKEYASIGAAVGGTAVGGMGVGALAAGAVIMTPVFLSRMATNKKAVNKLLAFDKMNFKSEILKDKALHFIISDVLDGLTSEEQAKMRNEMRVAFSPEQEATGGL
jgi:hypothetical protein